jgi:hypothetical protein
LSPVHTGLAGRRLDSQSFVYLSEPDPTALSVEATIHEFLSGQFHHIDLAAMDGDEEAGVERLDASRKIMVDARGGSARRGGHRHFLLFREIRVAVRLA